MTQRPGTITALIDISKLPSLPQTLIELIDLCNSPDRDLQQIGALVARDASISARILQLANSAFIGARKRFTDIEQAVIYLGIDTIRNLAISVSVHETFSSFNTAGILNIGSFWHHSFLTAVLAKIFSQAVSYPDPAEAYLTGLLHDIGKLLLFASFPERYPAILEQECSGNMLPIFERGNLGITHAEASSLLVSQWNLQQRVTDAVFNHHEDEESAHRLDLLGRILYSANRLSNTLVLTPDNHDASAQRLLGIDNLALQMMIRQSHQMVDDITQAMGITIQAAPLALLEPSKRSQAGRADLTRKVQTIAAISGVIDNLLKAENLSRVVRIIEESFQILFNIRSCLLLLPDLDTGIMRIHVSTSSELPGHDELSIPITMNKSGILADCLARGSIIHASPADKAAIEELENQCLQLLGTDGLIAVPVPLEESLQAILVAGVGEAESTAMMNQQETLVLMAGQIGMRIRLERMQQRSAAEQLTALNRIARQIAHELNNPVATLQNYLVALQTKLSGHPDIQQDISLISSEIGQIAAIAAQLTDLSSSTVSIRQENVDLNMLLTTAVEFYRQSLLPESTTAIVLELDPKLPRLNTNGAGIRQIIGNLIKNSLEALNNSGSLTVRTAFDSTREHNGSISITVEDNGPGTPPDLADSIFTAGVTSKGSGHVGLGLAITRKLVQELGGTISYSSGMAAGTRFTISLPLS